MTKITARRDALAAAIMSALRPSDAPVPPVATATSPAVVVALHFLDLVAAAGGPQRTDLATFDAWLRHCQQLVAGGELDVLALRARAEALGLLEATTLQGRAFRKPRGYAGDFEMIDLIYRRASCPDARLTRWDDAWQAHGAAQAVRNRKSYFLALLDRLVARHGPGAEPEVLDIASGPARDVAEHLVERPASRCRFTCLDLDAEAITFARALIATTGAAERVQFVHGNALRWQTGQQFDLVWSAGLFDYLPDRLFVRLLERLWERVRPDGELVVGNFDPANPSRPYMELLGDWHLIHRTGEQLLDLAGEAGLPAASLSVGREPLGINLFLHARRPAEGAWGSVAMGG